MTKLKCFIQIYKLNNWHGKNGIWVTAKCVNKVITGSIYEIKFTKVVPSWTDSQKHETAIATALRLHFAGLQAMSPFS